MKAYYLCENPDVLRRVYASGQMCRLAGKAEVFDGIITDPEDPALAEADAIFTTWGMPVCSIEQIRRCMPKVKAVFYAAGSVQSFARPFLESGIRVFSAWRANAVPVVQYTFAQIILALKGYFTVQPLTRTDRMAASALHAKYPGVFDVKIGLLGCGAIGSRLAEMLKALDVEVWVYDPFLSDARARELNVKKADMAEIFAGCGIVSNHLANLPETQGIIRREYLLSMQPYSTFINTGRGPQLNEKDLLDMLTLDPTRTALLDVLTEEHLSDENPLNALPNCLITPHIAGSSGLEVRRMADYMIEAFDCFESGKDSCCEVRIEMLGTMA